MTVSVPTAEEFATLAAKEAAAEARITTNETQTAANTTAIVELAARVAALSTNPPPPPPLPPEERTPLRVVLNLGGGQLLTFDELKAKDIGDYVGPFVHQHCLRQVIGAFLVDFRLDANGLREECVIEYGTLIDLTSRPPKPLFGTPTNLGAYTATISGGGLAAPLVIAVPNHWWGARWRWQSAPRPFVRDMAALVAMKAVFPLDAAYAYGAPASVKTGWAGPMSTGPVRTDMPTTGTRPDLGIITEWQALHLLGVPGYEDAVRAGGEASGTMAFHFRDAATGALVDLSAHPYLAIADAVGDWAIPQPSLPAGTTTNFFWLDASHMPAAAFVPWMLTDDPYFLEGAMAAAQYNEVENNYRRYNDKLPRMACTAQPRAFAWGARDQGYMAAFAPETPPSWLLSRKYWQESLADSRTYAQKFLDANVSPCTTVFKAMTFCNAISMFMQDYQNIVFAWIKRTGLFPEWNAIVAYAATPRMVMSNPTDVEGWDHRFQTPYILPLQDARLGAGAFQAGNINYSVPPDPNTPIGWAELWKCFCAFAASGREAPWTDPSTWAPNQLVTNEKAYLPEARGALAALSLAGVPGAKERHDWLANAMTKQFPDGISGAAFNWTFPPA